MKLVVEFKYVSMIHKPIIASDWTKYELDIEKIGLFNKPKLDVRNLSIKVIRQLKDTLICTINNELVTNIKEQKLLDKNNNIDVENKDYRLLEKQRISKLKNYNKGKDHYSCIPVTNDKLLLSTPTMDTVYYYILYVE